MATDTACPVCGMKVDENTAEKATYEGKNYYFCSRECKDTFNANPSKYVGQTATAKP
jgi:Cu+-exporting ATPase